LLVLLARMQSLAQCYVLPLVTRHCTYNRLYKQDTHAGWEQLEQDCMLCAGLVVAVT
jgi:hypothetical protein